MLPSNILIGNYKNYTYWQLYWALLQTLINSWAVMILERKMLRIWVSCSLFARSLDSTSLTEKAMAPHSSTFAWKIPRTEEPGVHGVAEGWTRLSNFTFTFHFHALEKEMATHSRILVWRIPGTGEPGGLPSMGSHRFRHDWSSLAAAAAVFLHQTTCL